MACYPGQPLLKLTTGLQDPNLESDHSIKLEEYNFNSNLRPQSTQSIAKWLDENYHYEDGICLPRSTIYEHYKDHCQRENLQEVNAASFGKIIRQQYPQLTTRRLGTRGQSKYHYFGLGIKPTSRYYTVEYLEKQHGGGSSRKEPETKKTHAYYASREKPSAVLPAFPKPELMDLPSTMSRDMLNTFMVMYRTHCQRILDSVVRASFKDIQSFLYHFWQGMPPHLHSILATDVVSDLIAVCDTTLYKAITNVYITSPLQSTPENVTQEVQQFANDLKGWLRDALKGLPDSLKAVKYQIAAVFKKSLQRQRSMIQLADATRNALHGEDPLDQLLEDWAVLDIENILAHTLFAVQPLKLSDHCTLIIPEFLDEFCQLMAEHKTSVEDFVVWVERVVERCISKNDSVEKRKELSRTFLLTWKFFTSKIVRELTLMSAPSFGTFHLIHMLVDDYIVHVLESMMEREEEEQFTRRIKAMESGVLPEPSPSTTTGLHSTTNSHSLIAAPPSTFTLEQHSRRSSAELPSPEETFTAILSPTLESLPANGVSRGSTTSLASTGQQRNNIDSGAETNTLQGLISSHGIGSYHPLSGTQSELSHNQSLRGSPEVLQGSTVVTTSHTRHIDPSLSFAQSGPQPSSLSSFSVQPLSLPPHLHTDNSLTFDLTNPGLNGLLPDSTQHRAQITKGLTQHPNICVASTTHQNEGIFSTASNLSGMVPQLPVSLAHPIIASGGLPNPSGLPLFPTMPNMYSYQYPSSLSLPSQTTNTVHPFPPQVRYPAPYVTPSIYGPAQPPITNRNFNR